MDKKLIFMHLPKCGGTTFHSILERMYLPKNILDINFTDNVWLNKEEFDILSTKEKSELELIKGHIKYGIHKFFPGKSEYITFLRDPVERIISFYFYVKRKPNHRLYEHNLFNDKMSLYDFTTKLKDEDINNGQIRYISGIVDKEELMLEKALENIENHFSFVGTLEKFDESLIILQKMYNWSLPYYGVRNKTSDRPRFSNFDDKTIEAIKYHNSGDILLYEKIRKELEVRLSNEDNLNQKLWWLNTISKTRNLRKYYSKKAGELMSTIYKNALNRVSN
jgi:hypothetical protein